jgi:hypothetical protein
MAKYKVITPAGSFIVNSIIDAREYKRLYGYPFYIVADPPPEPCELVK